MKLEELSPEFARWRAMHDHWERVAKEQPELMRRVALDSIAIFEKMGAARRARRAAEEE